MTNQSGRLDLKIVLTAAMLIGHTAMAVEVTGQGGYENDWYKVSAGGSTIPMTGGAYGVAGTIGQSDVSSPGFISGGDYILLSGYWAAEAEPLPDQLFSDRFEPMGPVQPAATPDKP